MLRDFRQRQAAAFAAWRARMRLALAAWWRRWKLTVSLFGFAFISVFAFPLLPDRYDPTAPPDLTEAPNFVTSFKYRMLARNFGKCVSAVNAAGLRIEPHSIASSEEGCGLDQGLLLRQSRFPYSAPVRLTCPMMAALAQWENHVVRKAADEHLSSPIARVVHFGTYACRNVNGLPAGPRSGHARANAMDIAGFILEDGSEVSVLKHWDAGDARAAFLRAVRDGSCAIFPMVLSPDYNARHKDHFHFEMSRWGTCS